MLAFKTPKAKAPLPGNRQEHAQRYFDCMTSAGFTLLEIMVCLSIISIVLIAIYRMHSQTLLMNQSTQFYTTAPLLAQRRLTEVELDNSYDFKALIRNEFDIVIMNPPYFKISKKSEYSKKMSDIIYGQPNIYALFMAMGVKFLNSNGKLIAITPRSFCNGLYFKAFFKIKTGKYQTI